MVEGAGSRAGSPDWPSPHGHVTVGPLSRHLALRVSANSTLGLASLWPIVLSYP